MASESNIGQRGVQSIRIMGQTIQDLPFAAQAHARQQLPLAEDTERQNHIQNVLKRYPKAKIVYLHSRIDEAQENIVRLARVKMEMRAEITRYHGLIAGQAGKVSYHEIEPEIMEVSERADMDLGQKMHAIRELKENVADYSVDEMHKQIKQFEESIERFDAGIQQENDSIAELRETIGKCSMRDLELSALGVKKATIG